MPKTAHALPLGERKTIAERLARLLIGNCYAGDLCIQLPGLAPLCLRGERPGVRADIAIDRWSAVSRFIGGGEIAFANAYRNGHWTTTDLGRLFRWAADNERALDSALSGNIVSRTVNRLRHRRRENSRPNSRRNISAHYDLGNDFYGQWLDPSMTYSSGLYRSAEDSLEEAQAQKIDRVCSLLELSGGEQVLEIGCGWGAVAERLTATHGCSVTGLTLSQPQLAYTNERLARAGLSDRADIRLQDYRDVDGRFDRIVSIEMLEAVGEAYWPQYFSKIRDCLAPGGVAVLQVITISPDRYPAYRERPDFIQLEIFPGGALPTGEIIASLAAAAGLTLTATETFAASYARTLAEWRHRFNSAWDGIQPLGFDDPFRRLWNYYLTYCEVGFSMGALDVGLYQIKRPE